MSSLSLTQPELWMIKWSHKLLPAFVSAKFEHYVHVFNAWLDRWKGNHPISYMIFGPLVKPAVLFLIAFTAAPATWTTLFTYVALTQGIQLV